MSLDLGRSAVILGAVLAYMAVTSLVALALRSRTNSQFMVAGRALPAAVVGVLMMSEFIGAQSTVGTAQAAFEKGVAAGWSVLVSSIGFLLLALGFAKKIRASSQTTISGLVEQRFGPGARIVVSLLMIYALLLVNVGNYTSGAAALSTALHLNLTASAVIIAVVSAAYYVFGGLKGTAYVALAHSATKLVGIAVLVAVAASLSGGLAPMREALPASYFTWDGAVGAPTIVAWLVGAIGAIFSTQYIVQALAASRTPAAAQRSTFIAALLCLPLGFALGFIGVAARFLYPGQKSLYALPVFISKMSTPLAALVTVSLVASVLVSVSTVAVATTSLVIRDFYVPWRKPSPDRELRVTRLVGMTVGVIPLICVFFTPHILALAFFSRALRLSITIVALIAVYLPWIRSGRAAVAALIVSCLATTAWYLLGNPFGIDNMYVAAAIPPVVFLIQKLLPNRPPAEVRSGQETHA